MNLPDDRTKFKPSSYINLNCSGIRIYPQPTPALMHSPMRIFALAALLLSVEAVTPTDGGVLINQTDTTTPPMTDNAAIFEAISNSPQTDNSDNTNIATPDGYQFVFGPTGGANNAPGYMGFVLLDTYDVNKCASYCNSRGADSVGGVCQYFNIWQAVDNGVPTSTTCSMYYLPTNASTADNQGQGNLKVIDSRGYSRISILRDGGFEGYNPCNDFCFTASYDNWIGTSSVNGTLDASVFDYTPYARTGHSSALLGAAYGGDPFPGTLTPAAPLKTKSGKSYVVQAFMASAFSGEESEASAHVNISWNGAVVGSVSGYSLYVPVQVPVVATGDDVLAFTGGAAPAWTFIDDVTIFEA
ncbi:hypothetical protein B0H11DRAFT_1285386 [Mycena galericulata]|nr:hypothetical protein B0H11DRAFT_1285386 [Mycena galericulata]